jgi:hypothetical protein
VPDATRLCKQYVHCVDHPSPQSLSHLLVTSQHAIDAAPQSTGIHSNMKCLIPHSRLRPPVAHVHPL